MVRKVLSLLSLVFLALGVVYIVAALWFYRGGDKPPWDSWHSTSAFVRFWIWALPYIAFALFGLGLASTYILWCPRCWTVTAKELRTYFTSPIAYSIMFAVFLLAGVIFWWSTLAHQVGEGGVEVGESFKTTCFLLLFISPLLTMRLFAEEKASGTYEILMTRPVHDAKVVIGKYLAASGVMLVILAGTLVQPLALEIGGKPEWGTIWTAYLGLALVTMAFVAIGLFTSSLTSSQIASAALTLLALLVSWLLSALRWVYPGKLISKVGEYLSVNAVMDEFAWGTIDTTRLVYLGSVIIFFLFAAWMTLFMNRSK